MIKLKHFLFFFDLLILYQNIFLPLIFRNYHYQFDLKCDYIDWLVDIFLIDKIQTQDPFHRVLRRSMVIPGQGQLEVDIRATAKLQLLQQFRAITCAMR